SPRRPADPRHRVAGAPSRRSVRAPATVSFQSNADRRRLHHETPEAEAPHRAVGEPLPAVDQRGPRMDPTGLARPRAGADQPRGARQGSDVGRDVARQIRDWRSTDGSGATVTYTPGTDPGDWRPTPPGNLPALAPQWPYVTPFALSAGSQFRPAPPPALTSVE